MEPIDDAPSSRTNDSLPVEHSSSSNAPPPLGHETRLGPHEHVDHPPPPPSSSPQPPSTSLFPSPTPLEAAEAQPPADLRPLRPRLRKPAPKGILKAPTVQASRFSFRRDILQPFNTRLAYAGYPAQLTPSEPVKVEAAAAAVAAVGSAAAAAAAGFWGSALKRLSVVTNAAAVATGGVVQPATRDVREDGPLHASPTTVGGADDAGLARVHSRDGSAAPHTPTKGPATATLASATPYATVRTSVANSTPLPPPPQPPLSVGELKKVSFRMATLKVIYPINGPNGPLAPWEEGRTKKRVNTEHRAMRHKALEGGESKGWTGESLGRLYAECCRTREEPGIERVRRALRENPKMPPKSFDLSNELLSHGAIEALSDLLSVDFGLKKLTLESCGLDDESLKPLLHALLVSGSVPTLSLANNKRIKAKGWKLIAIFTRKARFLRYLDLSENSMDRKAVEYLVQALTPFSQPTSDAPSSNTSPSKSVSADSPPTSGPSSPSPAPTPPPTLSIDTSSSPETTEHRPVILGLGISADEELEPSPEHEYLDDEESQDNDPEPLFTVAPLLKDDPSSHAATVLSIRLENCGLKGQALEALAHGVRSSSLKHISIRRNRINALGAVAVAIMIRDFPVASDHSGASSTSSSSELPPLPSPTPTLPPANGGFFESSSNSVTARQTLQAPYVRKPQPPSPRSSSPSRAEDGDGSGRVQAAAQAEREAWNNSEARNRLRKQIEELPRTGSLLTLDVKGNDIRNGVTYIAQVLKRNRTLKVLNLSENKIDVQGLVSIAEALKFNSTLETLDMSLNPCCGPGLEGITTLRAAITINSNLKRVFLNSTDLSSEGAIALAEFLPEAKSLIHLDLTGNFDIDIAGVLALSVSVKMNNTLRCLDLNIPANDPDFARLSQEILQCCVRNTEIAQEESLARGNKVTIAAPILKSAVARDLKTRQEKEDRARRTATAYSKSKDDILSAAEECRVVLSELLENDVAAKAQGIIVAPSEVMRDLLVQAQLAEAQLAEAIAATSPGTQKDRAELLCEQLTTLLDRAKSTYATSPPVAPLTLSPPSSSLTSPNRRPNPPQEHVSSPSFSIGNSDDDDEEDDDETTPTIADAPKVGPPAMPSISIPGTDIDVEEEEESGNGSPRSPMESQSRFLTLEEGEVFRRGTALETVDDEELVDVSGEELRKEILETPVQRSPRASIVASDGRPDDSFLHDP